MTTAVDHNPGEPLGPGRTIIEASAGTGKTYAIAAEVTSLVALEDLDVREAQFREAACQPLDTFLCGSERSAIESTRVCDTHSQHQAEPPSRTYHARDLAQPGLHVTPVLK